MLVLEGFWIVDVQVGKIVYVLIESDLYICPWNVSGLARQCVR